MKVLKKVLSSLIIFVMCFGFLAVLIPQENLAIEQEIEIVSITEENETDETKYVGEEGTGELSGIVVDANSNFEMPSSLSQKTKIDSFVDSIKYYGSSFGASDLPSQYRTVGLTVKNQQTTGECWAFVTSSMVEAYNIKHGNAAQTYSPRHIDYTCSKSFSDVSSIQDPLLNRETSEKVGNYMLTQAYLSSAKGPVLESSMPFSDDTDAKIPYSSLKQDIKQFTNEIKFFPGIYKKYSNGSVTYHKNSSLSQSVKYSDTELAMARQNIKQHIYENGGVASMVYQKNLSEKDIYNGEQSAITSPNHAVFIVGWDDDYIATGWLKRGAYICLNSYGTQNFYNGYIYVSYDDSFIEKGIIGVSDVENYDIDHVYEYDPWGSDQSVASNALTSTAHNSFDYSEITAVNVYNKASSNSETLKKVGFMNWSIQKAEIYYTDEFATQGFPINFQKVKNTTSTLGMGFHVLDLDTPVTISKSKYAIAVRYIEDNVENIATAACESYSSDSSNWWGNVVGNQGESYFLDKFNVSSGEQQIYWSLPRGEGKYVNASIKGYTDEAGEQPEPPDPPDPPEPPTPSDDPEDLLISDKYTIDGNYRRILMVEPGTTIEDFCPHVGINSKYSDAGYGDLSIYDSEGTHLDPSSMELVKTGYKILASKTYYEIAVIGDISGDGKRDIIDLAKFRSHILERTGYILSGIYLCAGDMNGNGEVNIIDMAQLRKLLLQ